MSIGSQRQATRPQATRAGGNPVHTGHNPALAPSAGRKYLIMDRDSTFCQSFRGSLSNEGVKLVRLPPRSPKLNAHLERFFGSLKSECLHELILFGETATRKAVRSFLEHYHTERNHQGLGNELIVPMAHPPDVEKEIETTERLGGLLRSYPCHAGESPGQRSRSQPPRNVLAKRVAKLFAEDVCDRGIDSLAVPQRDFYRRLR